jgi:DNA repair photolyase
MNVQEIHIKGVLTRSRIPGVDYSLNPYVGCFFGCKYCYASFMRRFTGHDEPWGEFVDVKVNAPEVLARQLKRLRPGHVTMSLVTDPYQPIERKYELTRRCLEVFLKLRPRSELFSLSILTRSVLVLRDPDLLRQLPSVEVGMSVTTNDEVIRRIFEPRAPAIPGRIETLRKLKAAGIQTYAFIGPMLPMDPKRLAKQLAGAVDHVLVDRMNYTWKTRRLYEAHGLEHALEPEYFTWARRELEEAFERLGIPAEYVGRNRRPRP